MKPNGSSELVISSLGDPSSQKRSSKASSRSKSLKVQDEVAPDPLIEIEKEENEFGGTITIRRTRRATLEEIERRLAESRQSR